MRTNNDILNRMVFMGVPQVVEPEKEKSYVIKFGISDPYYIAKWGGDPGRTYCVNSALRFLSRSFAENVARKVIAKYPQRYSKDTHWEIEEIDAE